MSGEAAVVCDSGTMHDLRTNFSKNNALLFTDSLTRPDSNDVDFVHSHDDGFEHCSSLIFILSVQISVNRGDCALQVKVDFNSTTHEPQRDPVALKRVVLCSWT